MMTSALALSQILSLASKRSDDERFLSACAECLDVSGPDAELEVLYHLVRLVKNIDSDIDALGLDEQTTRTLHQEAAPFVGIKNLSQVHQTIKQVKGGFLNPNHMSALIRLHAAFAHSRPIKEINEDARNLIEDFKSALSKLVGSDVPEELKDELALHLKKIISTLENYYFFSEKQLDHSLQALVGALVLNAEEADKHHKAIGPLKTVVAKLLTAFSSVGRYTAIARKFTDDGKALLDAFNSSSGG